MSIIVYFSSLLIKLFTEINKERDIASGFVTLQAYVKRKGKWMSA